MQNYVEPLFRKGRVLKKEHLDALKDFPGDLARLGLEEWADGILYGFDISFENNRENSVICIRAGAVRHHGQVILTKTESLPFHAYEQQITVCLRLYPCSCTEDFTIHPLELRLKNGGPGADEMELGRFRLSRGARLRKDYQNLRDCRTAYNTLDLTHVPYAGPGGVTLSPVLLRIFARMVLDKKDSPDMDISFAFLCLDHAPVSRECLLRYLCRRSGEPFRELSHNEIYERLVRITGPADRAHEPGRTGDGPAVF